MWSKLATVATAFGQTAVRRDGSLPDRLTSAWIAAQGQLPHGWSIDALRYVSAGPSGEAASDAWVVVAVGPAGEQRTHQAADAVAALDGLARSFDSA